MDNVQNCDGYIYISFSKTNVQHKQASMSKTCVSRMKINKPNVVSDNLGLRYWHVISCEILDFVIEAHALSC
jgi:hypothetical protein